VVKSRLADGLARDSLFDAPFDGPTVQGPSDQRSPSSAAAASVWGPGCWRVWQAIRRDARGRRSATCPSNQRTLL